MSDAIDHGRAVLGTIFKHRSAATIDYAFRYLTAEHFTDSVQAALFTMCERYHQQTQEVMPRAALDDICRHMPPGSALKYEEYFDLCCESAVSSSGDFRWSVQQLGELYAERATGEAIANAMEILTQGKQVGKQELKGWSDARAYLASALAEPVGSAGGGMEATDWDQLWAEEPDDADWLCEPLIERGQTVSWYAVPGTGKSLVALELAAGLATGRAVLGNPAAEPVNVTYVDKENRRKDLKQRLRDMGYGPAVLKGHLFLYSFPELEPLDTPAGGARLIRQALVDKAALVVLDTTCRVVAGAENEADTFNALYRCTIEPLRKAGIAVLRLDHPGKDRSKGARGSSGKQADVDTEWELTDEGASRYALRCHKDRGVGTGDQAVELRRSLNPLRHEVVRSVVSTKAERLISELHRLGATAETTVREARELLKAKGIKTSNATITEAVKQFKSFTGSDDLIDFGD